MTTVLAIYSESGGATKTTTAVSLAVSLAHQGRSVLLIDLDPRAAASRWVGAEPKGPGLDVSAILGNTDPDGWANDLAVPVPDDWHAPSLRMIPSGRLASVIEGGHADHQELRLRRALTDVEADIVVLDCPNRQGGALTLNALHAATGIVYAAKPDEDGREGVEGARTSVTRHQANLGALGAREVVQEVGLVVGAVTDTVTPRIERHTLDGFKESYPDLLLTPYVPHRTIVREARATGTWFGNYAAGGTVAAAYRDLADQITNRVKEST